MVCGLRPERPNELVESVDHQIPSGGASPTIADCGADVVERIEQRTVEVEQHQPQGIGQGMRDQIAPMFALFPRVCHHKGSTLVRLSRRTFSLALAGAPLLALAPGCSRKTPRVPTRPAGGSSVKALGADLHAEILDTEEGAVTIDDHDPQAGPKDAHCVIINFSDFQCPFCRDIAEVLARIRRESPKQVRLVYKHCPLPMHREAREAAVAAQVVFLEAGTDAFWRFHDRAYAHPHDMETSVLTNWARDEGVKAEAITLRAAEAERRVAQDLAMAERLGIRGTPHLMINARAVAGAFPYDVIRAWVDEEI